MRIDDGQAEDLIHEFLVERAPAALATFRPTKGDLQGWLFVVFRRFAVGTLRESSRHERLLAKVAEASAAEVAHDEGFQLDLAALEAALTELPPEEHRAMLALLSSGGTARGVARVLGTSRWRAASLISAALDKLTSQLATPAMDSIVRSEREGQLP